MYAVQGVDAKSKSKSGDKDKLLFEGLFKGTYFPCSVTYFYDELPIYRYDMLKDLTNSDFVHTDKREVIIYRKMSEPRPFDYGRHHMTLTVTAPFFIQNDGSREPVFLSEEDETVNIALRMLATNYHKNILINGALSVTFTLYRLWEEIQIVVKKMKRITKFEYGESSYERIMKSLTTLSGTHLEIAEKKNVIFSAKMIDCGVFDDTTDELALECRKHGRFQEEKYAKGIVYCARFNFLIADFSYERNKYVCHTRSR
jgi:hypothetical protein